MKARVMAAARLKKTIHQIILLCCFQAWLKLYPLATWSLNSFWLELRPTRWSKWTLRNRISHTDSTRRYPMKIKLMMKTKKVRKLEGCLPVFTAEPAPRDQTMAMMKKTTRMVIHIPCHRNVLFLSRW